MNNTQINKLLELLKNGKLEDLKAELTKELLATESKTKSNQFATIKKYLSKQDDFRPVLKTIEWKNNKQFICNGFTAYIFNKYKQELEALPNTKDESQCINIYGIFDKSLKYEPITEQELKLLTNLKKYKTLYKAQEKYDKKQTIPVYFNNKFFDIDILEELTQIIDLKNSNIQLTHIKQTLKPLQIISGEIDAIILPIRMLDNAGEQTKEFTNNFIKMLEE